MKTKKQKREEAIARSVKYAALSIEEKMKGAGKKELAKLQAKQIGEKGE